jgi:hypothetical protein
MPAPIAGISMMVRMMGGRSVATMIFAACCTEARGYFLRGKPVTHFQSSKRSQIVPGQPLGYYQTILLMIYTIKTCMIPVSDELKHQIQDDLDR